MSQIEYQRNEDAERVEELAEIKNKIVKEIGTVIVGQKTVLELLLISLMSSGHSLFVGVPGLAKTLLVSTLSNVTDLEFNRIQFTPDLMPSDITGSEVLEKDVLTDKRFFKFIKGPIFCNILLADEINRASPKTQAALLQAMQEHRVTVGGETYRLDPPFLIFATQNPIEQEGTYPLPEAELDRFMFQIDVDYPTHDEEVEIAKSTTSMYNPSPRKILDAEKIISYQELVHRVPVSDHVAEYAVSIARSTRPNNSNTDETVKKWVSWGVGPRGSQYLILGSKAKAVLEGRFTPTTEDVKLIAPAVLKHRVVLNYRAEAEGIKAIDVINELLEKVKPNF